MAANDYATLAEMKAHLPDLAGTLSDGSRDVILTSLLTRASRLVDRATNRKPGAFYITADSTLYFDSPRSSGVSYGGINTGQGYGEIAQSDSYPARRLRIGELADVPTSVAVTTNGDITNYTAWASTDYIMWPYNAVDFGEPYRAIDIDMLNGSQRTWYWFRKAIKIVGPFGYSRTVPDYIKELAIIQAARWYKRGQLAFQDRVGLSDSTGSIAYMNAIDQDLKSGLDNYARIAI